MVVMAPGRKPANSAMYHKSALNFRIVPANPIRSLSNRLSIIILSNCLHLLLLGLIIRLSFQQQVVKPGRIHLRDGREQ